MKRTVGAFVMLLFFSGGSRNGSRAFPSATKLIERITSPKQVIRRDETVIFFPTSSYRAKEEEDQNQWIIPIHGWIFDDERRGFRKRAFLALLRSALSQRGGGDHQQQQVHLEQDDEAQILQQTTVIDDSAAKEILARRVLPFIVDNHRRRKITVRIGNLERELPETSLKNGHFKANLLLSDDEIGDAKMRVDDSLSMIEYEAVTGIDGDSRSFRGSSLLVDPVGISVISDIDDTVKVSHVLEKRRLLRHTFLEEFQAVPGMSRLYQSWRDRHKASFHFVSSSPWQLYEEIASFLTREGFPAASFHLKSVRLKDRSLLSLFADPMAAKIFKISNIMEQYPQRQFVLVGDTGERDPEVYGELCRRYPDRIGRVFLRDVTSHLSDERVAELNKKEQKKRSGIEINGPDRFTNAFQGVPPETWSLFTDAATIDF